MGFGLTGANASFQRAINLVFKGLTWTEVLAYLDNVIVLGKTVEEHLASLKRVFERFRLYNLKLKPRKCSFLCSEILGKLGNRIVPFQKGCYSLMAPSKLESFLGSVNYHRTHVKEYAKLIAPLYHIAKPTSTFE